MRRFLILNCLSLAFVLTGIIALPAAAQPGPAAPVPAPAAPRGPSLQDPMGDRAVSDAVLEAAITELRTEFIRSLEKGGPLLRQKANYFVGREMTLSQLSLVNALDRQIAPIQMPDKRIVNDPRLAAYVKWQILTGAPKEWEKEMLPRVVEIYRKSPFPQPRFGSTEADRRRLDNLLATAKREETVTLTDVVTDAVNKGEEANAVIFAYREALYSTLPAGYDRFSSGLRDAFERLQMGWTADDFMKRLEHDITAWANSNAGEPRQYAAISQLIARLRLERTPKYYVGIAMSRTTKQPYWMSRTEAIDEAKKLADLQKLLDDVAGVRRPTIETAPSR